MWCVKRVSEYVFFEKCERAKGNEDMRTALIPALLLAQMAIGQPKTIDECANLTDPVHRERFEQIAREFTLSDCCEGTLAHCLDASPSDCSLARRLSTFACKIIEIGNEPGAVMKALNDRYRSMTTQNTVAIKKGLFEAAGDSAAPVTISVYISGTCPACKFLLVGLHKEVISGRLAGKARIEVKLLTNNMVDQALLSANQYGKFWPYIEELNKMKVRATRNDLYDIGRRLGITPDQLARGMENPDLLKKAKESRKEAKENGVEYTPTTFINGHRYESFKHPIWITDAAEYEFEKYHR